MPEPYGMPIGSEDAKKAAAAALAEARKNGWTMAAAVVDTGGHLVYFEKMDGTQTGSVAVAHEQGAVGGALPEADEGLPGDARQRGRRPSRLRLEGAVPVDGGVPLVSGGKTVGAIGVSGGSSAQDGQCARAGAEALK